MTEGAIGTASPTDPATPSRAAASGWPSGWYPDPTGGARLRWWNGRWWTTWTSDGHRVAAQPITGRKHLGHSDIEHLRFVDSVFLPEMAGRAGITAEQASMASQLVWELAREANNAPPPELAAHLRERIEPPAAFSAPDQHKRSRPTSVRGPGVTTLLRGPAEPDLGADQPWQAAPPSAATPHASRLAVWWRQTGASIRSDLAVHGIAYLGVLLFFVGAFGLVAFAFGDVRRELRPVAEILIAVMPFGAAYLLMRRGAVIVGRALEVVGGLTAPLMLITSFLDGVGIPPDAAGPALVIGLTLSCIAITGGYAFWVSRHAESGLRFVVAPMAWLTVAMATLGLGRPIPDGEDVATPASAQVAATLAALAVTVALARRRPAHRLSGPTLTSAVPGVGLLALLCLLTWLSPSQAPTLSEFAGAILVIATLELLAERLGPPLTLGLIEPVWWFTALLAIPAAPNPRVAVGFLGFLVIVELAIRRGGPTWSLALPVLGALCLIVASTQEPWLCVGLLTASSAWVNWRRLRPWPATHNARALDVAAGALPLMTLAALGSAASVGVALAGGAAFVLAATAPALRPLLRRSHDDRFWPVWWGRWLALTAAATTGAWVTQFVAQPGSLLGGLDPATSWTLGSPWLLVASAAGLACAGAIGPIKSLMRPWAVVGLVALLSATACLATGTAVTTAAAILTGLALPVVAWANARPTEESEVAAMTGMAGHYLALLALTLFAPILLVPIAFASDLPTGSPTGRESSATLALALGLSTMGWLITTICDDRGRSPVGLWLAATGPAASRLPATMSALGLTATLSSGLATTGSLDTSRGPLALALAGLGLLLAAVIRIARTDRVASPTAWAAFLICLAAVGTGAPDPTARAVSLAATAAVVLILPRRRRMPVMVWTAWAVPAPLLATLAWQFFPAFREQVALLQVATSLIAAGGAITALAYAVDMRNETWSAHLVPRRADLVPPVMVGSVQVTFGALLAAARPDQVLSGWCLMAAGLFMLAIGAGLRIGSLAGAGIVVGWGGIPAILGGQLPASAWPAIVVSAALLGVAELTHRSMTDRVWWSRWDLPLTIAAGIVAWTALINDSGSATAPLTQAVVGFEAIAVALRTRRSPLTAIPLGTIGVWLILGGAMQAGGLWPAGALLLASVALTLSAVRASGKRRLWLQLGGAICAALAWEAAIAALSLSARAAADFTSLGAGALTVLASLLLGQRLLDRSWACTWSAVSAKLVLLTALTTLVVHPHPGASPATVAGLAMVSLAGFAFAFQLARAWVADAATLCTAATLGMALSMAQITSSGAAILLSAISTLCAALLMLPDSPNHQDSRRQPWPWRRWVAEMGILTTLGAIAVTAGTRSSAALVLALAVAAIQAAAVGSWRNSLAVRQLSPVLGCAALLCWIDLIRGGDASWSITVIGLTVLIMVALWRNDRRGHHMAVNAAEVVGLEMVGLVLLIGPTLWNTVTTGLAYALVGILLGVGLAAWAVLTRVRRRLIVGTAVVLTCVVLLLAVPALDLLPALGGVWIWVLIAVVGALALLIAALLEEGRAAIRHGAAWLAAATANWE